MLQKDRTQDRAPPNFFSKLGDKQPIRLFNTGTIRKLAENEFLFKKGTSDKTIYCVLSGTLRVVSRNTDSPGFRFKAGDFFAETGLSNRDGRISSVVAENNSSVFCLSKAAFDSLEFETQEAILKELHDMALSRVQTLEPQKESARLREAALTKYIKKFREPLGNYARSEIIVNIVKNIPRLPLHVTHLIELLASERASAKEVAALAKQDPSLVVDILKTINSSRYALQTEVTDVAYAITYMGFNEVYQIALSRCLMKLMPDSEGFREVHRHSLFLSYVASELCQSYDRKKAPLLSAIGLLHDIGKTVVLLLRKQNPKWSLFIEMLDPPTLGAMLLKEWNIPKQIWRTIEYQAYPAFCPASEIPSDQKANIALLYIAHAACDHLNKVSLDAFDHPYLDDYLRLLRFDSGGVEQIAKQNILPGLMAKSNRLPDFMLKHLALNLLAERGH
ncbi:MAG TPA: HDOD domain-containing protein [Syntrophobacteraceae bacterium]|nr:HDOD domain-containing protein [Syntrophobacteraceae bacterium]